MTTLFSSLTDQDKDAAVEHLIEESSPRHDFFLMIVLSVTMAAFGALMNSVAVIIGSMLIAPLLYPVLSLSMGIVMANRTLIMRSSLTILQSLAFAIPSATFVALLFGPQATLDVIGNPEIQSRIRPDILSAAVAFIAGIAASFALIKPQLNAAIPGIAISVSLIPPLAVTGIGLARFDWTMTANSLVLALVNAACIVFASSVVFSLMRLYTKQRVAKIAIKKEDRELREEKRGSGQA